MRGQARYNKRARRTPVARQSPSPGQARQLWSVVANQNVHLIAVVPNLLQSRVSLRYAVRIMTRQHKFVMGTGRVGTRMVAIIVWLAALQSILAGTYVRTAARVALTNGAAWDLGTVPGNSDIVVWTNTSATGSTTNGGSMSWSGIVFSATADVVIVNGAAALHTTNTLGAGGVDMSRAVADLTFQNDAIVLASTVVCNIASNRALSFSGKPPDVSGSGGFVKIGGGTLVATSQQNDYSGNTVISNGTFSGGQKPNFLPHGAGKGNVIVAAGAVLDTAQNNIIVNGLFGDGTVRCSLNSPRTVTVGDGNAAGVFGGTLATSFPIDLSLIKIGTNTFKLTGTNNLYQGGTIVSNGTLIVDNAAGYVTGTNFITVITNATLSGTGVITGPVTVNGAIMPGDKIGKLTTGSQTWNPGGSFVLNLDAVGSNGFLAVNGVVSIQSTASVPFTIRLVSLGGPVAAGQWTIATATGGVQNFSVDKFAFDTSQLQPVRAASSCSIEVQGNSLQVRIAQRNTTLMVR